MIYTIGYQFLTPEKLFAIAEKLDAVVIDVRSQPSGRVKKGFSKHDLEFNYGAYYKWWGNYLGGRMNITKEGLSKLDQFDNVENHCILMCQEHDPSDCHRHHDICAPYFRKALHIFEDDLYSVISLESDDPSSCGSL